MIDVIMLIWNAQPTAILAMMHLLVFTPVPIRLIVLDNGSEDRETTARLTSWLNPAQHKLIRNEKNIGVYAGFNQALREVESNLVVICNSDHLVFNGWWMPLETAIRCHDIAWASPQWLPEGPYQVAEVWHHLTPPRECKLLLGWAGTSCALLNWKRLKREVGEFDERFFITFGDADYVERMRDGQMRFCLVQGALTRHLGKQSRRVLGMEQDTEHELRDAAAFHAKWKDRPDILERHSIAGWTRDTLNEQKPMLWEQEDPKL